MLNNLSNLLLSINNYEENLRIDIKQKVNDTTLNFINIFRNNIQIGNRLKNALSKGKWNYKKRISDPEKDKRALCRSMLRKCK
jgi:hypothetical protein